MKKLVAILALAITTSAFADKIIIEARDAQGATTSGPHTSGTKSSDQNQYKLTYAKDVNANWQVDYSVISVQTQSTELTAGSRIEAGALYRNKIAGLPVYVRGGYGLKTTTAANFTYYSVEPGVMIPLGNFTGRVGYRFRDAVAPSNTNADETTTWRYGLGYNVTKDSSVWLRYDKMRGDTAQNVTFVAFEHKF
jgi:hypothetical protein